MFSFVSHAFNIFHLLGTQSMQSDSYPTASRSLGDVVLVVRTRCTPLSVCMLVPLLLRYPDPTPASDTSPSSPYLDINTLHLLTPPHHASLRGTAPDSPDSSPPVSADLLGWTVAPYSTHWHQHLEMLDLAALRCSEEWAA